MEVRRAADTAGRAAPRPGTRGDRGWDEQGEAGGPLGHAVAAEQVPRAWSLLVLLTQGGWWAGRLCPSDSGV